MSDPKPKFVCGLVSITGRPNAGKSTLLNAMLGTKLAIVGEKPQTTRTAVQGVVTTDKAQIIFVDTPGIHRSETLLNKRMMEAVRSSLKQRDLILYLVDAANPKPEEDREALDMVKKSGSPVALVLNKVDQVKEKNRLLPLIEQLRDMADFVDVIPISARKSEGLGELSALIQRQLPEGPALYPEDYLTDQPMRFLAAELIRERILKETRQEVPHSVAVIVEEWNETKSLTRITATIYVERDGQKAILIGTKGEMLKRIGTEARREIETLVGGKVYLGLFVKVRANWRESRDFLNEIDWRMMAGGEKD